MWLLLEVTSAASVVMSWYKSSLEPRPSSPRFYLAALEKSRAQNLGEEGLGSRLVQERINKIYLAHFNGSARFDLLSSYMFLLSTWGDLALLVGSMIFEVVQ